MSHSHMARVTESRHPHTHAHGSYTLHPSPTSLTTESTRKDACCIWLSHVTHTHILSHTHTHMAPAPQHLLWKQNPPILWSARTREACLDIFGTPVLCPPPCTHTHTHSLTHTHTHTYAHTHIYANTYTHTSTHVYLHIHRCEIVCDIQDVYVYIRIFTHLSMCTRTRVRDV